MSNFLHFLNTADVNALTQISGISHSLAENLVATRPFDSLEDCLKVHGMGKNLLSRARSAYEAIEVEPIDNAMLPVEQEAMPLEKSRIIAGSAYEDKPSFGARAGQVFLNVLRALLRLILLVLIIVGVVATIYYGAPYIREKFIVPVEQNAARVSELENEISDLQAQITDINNQLTETNSQLSETNNHMAEIKQSLEAHTAALAKLEAMQTTLETQLQENDDRTLLALKHEVILTRALDTLARARLYLAQSNFGLAKEDVQAAHDLLSKLNTESEDEVLAQAIIRLDMALGNMPAFPVVASGDLEIAWQILMTGKTIATATPEPTSTETPTPQSTVETTVTATSTP